MLKSISAKNLSYINYNCNKITYNLNIWYEISKDTLILTISALISGISYSRIKFIP